MRNALVTSIGSTAGDIVIKTLKTLDFYVVGSDIYPKEWVVDAMNVSKFYQAPYTSETEKYYDFLKKVCLEEKIDFLFPLTDLDVDFLNVRRTWFEEHNITLCISPKETLDILRNKKILQDYLANNCPYINSIPTKLYSEVSNNLPWDFPIVCKPYDGRSSQGLRYIHNEQEWKSFKAEGGKDKYIVEPFIEGKDIVMVEIVRNPETNQTIAATRGECLSTPHGCSLTVRLYQEKELENQSIRLANELNIKGSVNFEYIHTNDGKYYFVECNPRFSAGTEFTCISQYDVVTNHVRCFDGKPIDTYEFKHVQYIARKYEEYVTKTEE